MGAAVAVPAALTGISMLMGAESQRKQQKAQDKALKAAGDENKRKAMMFTELKGLYDKSVAAGEFDPTRKIADFEKELSNYAQKDIGNTAAAARTLGYKPGDSEPLKRVAAVNSDYQLKRAQGISSIKDNAFQRQFSALQGVNSGVPNTAGTDLQIAQMRQPTAQPNMANAFASIYQLFPQKQASMKIGGYGIYGSKPNPDYDWTLGGA